MSATVEVTADPIADARARVEALTARISTLAEREATAAARRAEIAARLIEIEETGRDVRLAAAREEYGPRKVARLLAELAEEEERLRTEDGELARDLPALASVLSELRGDLDHEAFELLRVEAAPLLERQRELVADAAEDVHRVARTWLELVAIGHELEQVRARIPASTPLGERRELHGLEPWPASFRAFAHALAELALLEVPIGAGGLRGFRELVPLFGRELVETPAVFSDVEAWTPDL